MLQVIRYEDKYEALWDRFVTSESINGTFLQTRNFLNYHPKERFLDHSLVVLEKINKILAVVPACEVEQDGKKQFVSHKGSTFGGLIINRLYYHSTQNLQDILQALDGYWNRQKFESVVLKQTPDLFAQEEQDLVEYMLRLNGFSEYAELSTYIDFSSYKDDILSNFKRDKRLLVRKMNEKGVVFRACCEDNEVAGFYSLLTQNLKKYQAKPIHTLEELLDFKNRRLTEIVKFYGVFYQDELLAAGMCFDFAHRVLHAQNLSADPFRAPIQGVNPVTYLYYGLIREAKERGYQALSWGISTEQRGEKLNFSLIWNKESFGSSYSLNRTFQKEIEIKDSG